MNATDTKRVQLALNVTDLDAAIEFYTKLFATPPAKIKPDYANFAIVDPPLKLVLIKSETGGTMNHLGVEVASSDDVIASQKRLAGDGIPTIGEQSECCYALQNKIWATDPDGARWEVYTVLADAEVSSAVCC